MKLEEIVKMWRELSLQEKNIKPLNNLSIDDLRNLRQFMQKFKNQPDHVLVYIMRETAKRTNTREALLKDLEASGFTGKPSASSIKRLRHLYTKERIS